MQQGSIKGLHHVSLKPVGRAEFEKTKAFYQQILGLSVVREWGEGDACAAMLSTGNSLLEISAAGTGQFPAGMIHHYALAVENVDGVVEAVRRAGCRVTMEPTDKVLPSEPPYAIRIAFFEGPCGECVELFEEK